MVKESDFQKKIKDELKQRFKGCYILKNDPTCIQGIPDLTILYKNKWATLEVKRSIEDRKRPRPNQELRVNELNEMSYSAFIYPENKEVIFDELQRLFEPEG